MTMPIVFVAVLAKQKEIVLPDWLECLEALDYPKKRIVLYVRSNNNTDATESILREWIAEHGEEYLAVYGVYGDVDVPVEKYGVHEWNEERFSVLAKIRQESISMAIALQVDYYFVIDVDNFILPHTLKS
jgi:cellulose synthase/poly-beta-1,6-N-acetylglucosamine synthase-like glycosyltransferase